MGKLELPLPALGAGKSNLASAAKDLENKIVMRVPENLRRSIRVRPYSSGGRTGLAIEYDDRAEPFVYAAIEYPTGGGREERIAE